MKMWDWYQRAVMGIIAILLMLITLRLHGVDLFPRVRQFGPLQVEVANGSIDVEVKNSPLEVEVKNSSLEVEVTNTPIEVQIVR